VSFWLVACNALLVAAVRGRCAKPTKFSYGNWKIAALLLLPPAYSLYAYSVQTGQPGQPPGQAAGQGINILLVQPNGHGNAPEAAGAKGNDLDKLVGLTSQGVSSKPDLIVWPEAAVQFPLFQFAASRSFISNEVRGWDTPLFTGMLAVRRAADGTPPGEEAPQKKRLSHFNHFNAAMMITPELASYIGQGKQVEPAMYYKRKLFPFVEFIPFVDQFPFLAKLQLQLPLSASAHNFTLGAQPETFLFKSRAGDKVRMGTLICFEEFYPGLGADLAASGAQFIAVIGDEWQFRPESARYFNMMVSGMRAIETGLPLVRNANNGYLALTDPHGVTTRIPGAQTSNTVIATLHPSSGNTFFVLHKNWFPLFCLFVAGTMLLWRAVTLLRSTVTNAEKPEAIQA